MEEIGSIVTSVLTSIVSADLDGVSSGVDVTASGIITSVTSDRLADVRIIVSVCQAFDSWNWVVVGWIGAFEIANASSFVTDSFSGAVFKVVAVRNVAAVGLWRRNALNMLADLSEELLSRLDALDLVDWIWLLIRVSAGECANIKIDVSCVFEVLASVGYIIVKGEAVLKVTTSDVVKVAVELSVEGVVKLASRDIASEELNVRLVVLVHDLVTDDLASSTIPVTVNNGIVQQVSEVRSASTWSVFSNFALDDWVCDGAGTVWPKNNIFEGSCSDVTGDG
jgi:hypothetical protein